MSSTNDLVHSIFLVLCGCENDYMQQELEKLRKPTKAEKFLGAKFRHQMR
jgi:hypothetical protein